MSKQIVKHRYAPSIVALMKWAGWLKTIVIYEDAISYTGSLLTIPVESIIIKAVTICGLALVYRCPMGQSYKGHNHIGHNYVRIDLEYGFVLAEACADTCV